MLRTVIRYLNRTQNCHAFIHKETLAQRLIANHSINMSIRMSSISATPSPETGSNASGGQTIHLSEEPSDDEKQALIQKYTEEVRNT